MQEEERVHDCYAKDLNRFRGINIKDSLGKSEKDLANYLKRMITDILFPGYMVFGNERSYQKEADLFALYGNGVTILVLEWLESNEKHMNIPAHARIEVSDQEEKGE